MVGVHLRWSLFGGFKVTLGVTTEADSGADMMSGWRERELEIRE